MLELLIITLSMFTPKWSYVVDSVICDNAYYERHIITEDYESTYCWYEDKTFLMFLDRKGEDLICLQFGNKEKNFCEEKIIF